MSMLQCISQSRYGNSSFLILCKLQEKMFLCLVQGKVCQLCEKILKCTS